MTTATDALEVPSDGEVRHALERARAMHLRMLAAWASDALELRRTGDHEPLWRPDASARAA